MNTRIAITTVIIYLSIILSAQKMEPGYALLEEQNYEEAKYFFNDVLQEYPNNKTAQICLARAMGLSDQKPQALEALQNLDIAIPDDYEVGLNLAEAYMWNKDFTSAINKYTSLITLDNDNFTAHLGYANALAGMQRNIEALAYINKALSLDPKNSGAENSKKYILIAIAYNYAKKRNHKLAESFLDSVDLLENNQVNAIQIRNLIADHKALKGYISYYHSEDNAFNTASGLSIYQSKAWNSKNEISVEAHLRTTNNTVSLAQANQDLFFLKNKTYLSEKLTLEAGIGMLRNKSGEINTDNIISSAQISTQINTYNYFSIGHQSSYLNYNSELVENNLRIDNVKLDHHLYSKYRIGFYNSILAGYLSDTNKNIITFSSLYYQWKENPVVKIGVNYSYIHFDKARPELYFSPDKYQVGEAFIHSENLNSSSKWKYKVLLAAGIQKVEQNKKQQILRLELQGGYQFSKELAVSVSYLYSNSAQINTLGTYEFQNLGVKLYSSF